MEAATAREARLMWVEEFLTSLAAEVSSKGTSGMGDEKSALRAAAVKHIEWLLTCSTREANEIVMMWVKRGQVTIAEG